MQLNTLHVHSEHEASQKPYGASSLDPSQWAQSQPQQGPGLTIPER
jgi:hypothetical protein